MMRLALFQIQEQDFDKLFGSYREFKDLMSFNSCATDIRDNLLRRHKAWFSAIGENEFPSLFFAPLANYYGKLIYDGELCSGCWTYRPLKAVTEIGVYIESVNKVVNVTSLQLSCSCEHPGFPPFIRFASLLSPQGISITTSFPATITLSSKRYMFFGVILGPTEHFTTIFRFGASFYHYNDICSDLSKMPEMKFPWNDPRSVEVYYIREDIFKNNFKDFCGRFRNTYRDSQISKLNTMGILGLLTNVQGDGNCGFRVVAFKIYGKENQWASVRRDLLSFLPKMQWDESRNENMALLLSHFQGSAPFEHWMDTENCLLLCSMTYRRVIVLYTPSNRSEVFVPIGVPISDYIDDPIGIFYDNVSHYQFVDLSKVDPSVLPLPSFHFSVEKQFLTDYTWRAEFHKWFERSSLNKFTLNSWY
jgi:hypothetical protein